MTATLEPQYFFIIGAMKAGTTSLYKYLSGHPDLYPSPRKEPRIFRDPGDPATHALRLSELFDGQTHRTVVLRSVDGLHQTSHGIGCAEANSGGRSRGAVRVPRAPSDRTHVVAVRAQRGPRTRDAALRAGPRKAAETIWTRAATACSFVSITRCSRETECSCRCSRRW